MERLRQRQGRTYITRKGVTHTEGAKEQQGGVKIGGVNPAGKGAVTFIDPYSYESSPEARVQLELESRGIRFAYRYFVDGGSATHVHTLIPDFAPEFTLPDYKVVIMIQGDFYGNLPGVIDKNGLAYVLLQADGWKPVIWDQSEITVEGVAVLMHRDLPALDHPTSTGPEIPSPYGHPLTMETRRRYMRGLALLKKIFTPKKVIGAQSDSTSGSRVRGFIHRIGDDGVRRRVANHPKSWE